jgi:excisionase family DNA binding protein
METTLENRIAALERAIKKVELAAKPMLSMTEAAQYTGYSVSSLYKLTSQKKIPHYKPEGKKVFFNRPELEHWLQQNRVKPADEVAQAAAKYCLTSKPNINRRKAPKK